MPKPKKFLSESTKHYSKEEKEIKLEAEEKMYGLEPLQKEAPEWLTDQAKEEYDKLYPLIIELPIKNLDLSLLAVYVQAYADYQQATKMLGQDVVTFTDRGSKINPWHRVKVDSYGIMNSIAGKLGLTISSRMAILETKEEKPEEIDKFGAMLDDD